LAKETEWGVSLGFEGVGGKGVELKEENKKESMKK